MRRPCTQADTAGIAIQEGEHSSVDDARAAMALYRQHREQWERDLRRRPGDPPATAGRPAAGSAGSAGRPAAQDEEDDDDGYGDVGTALVQGGSEPPAPVVRAKRRITPATRRRFARRNEK